MRYEWPSKIALALLGGLATCLPASGQTAAPAALPTLTSIKAVRALSQDEGGRGYPVRLQGIVTHIDERDDHSLIIHDGKLGQFIVPPAAAESAGSWLTLRRGDVVEIDGRTERGGFAPNVQPRVVRVVATSPLPAPKRISFGSLLTGRHDCDYIEVVGVVQRMWLSSDPNVRTLFADVAVEEGVVRAFFWEYSPADLKNLIDAKVRLVGNVGTIFGATGQVRGVSLFVGRISDIDVLDSAPDPFLRPVRPINSIYDYSTSAELNRRTRVRGQVTASIPGRAVEMNDFPSKAKFRFERHVIYIDDGTGAARVETEQPLRLTPGTVVDVAGFPAVTPAQPVIANAVLRVVGGGEEPQPVAIEGSLVLTPEHDAVLVRMQGQFLSTLRSPTQRIFVLKVGETVFDAALELEEPAAAGPLERIRPGSVVAVTGVYSYQWGPAPSFRLFLRSPEDLTVLSTAPWWTMRHTAVMIGMLALVAVAGGSWVRTSGNRKRQEYQAVLSERSRLGRELHDTLEQGLAGIGLQLEAVAGSMQSSPDTARQALDVAKQMLQYSQEEARRSVMDLRSQALESRDLAGALTDVARQMTVGTRALADVRVEGVPHRLDAAEEHHLLRIGLEALTNAVKHADARRVDIVIAFRSDATELIVQDDGCGLAPETPEGPGGHFGLLGIRERVDKLGGVLEVSGRPGAGTRLAVTIPAERGDVKKSGPFQTGGIVDTLRIMLVDDHYLVRMGLRSILALEPDMAICAEASSGEQARALFRQERPDVTLMDLRLPGMNGTATTQEIRAEFPDARIVMISTYIGDEEIYGALHAGAMGYLVKSVQREELTAAIRKAAAGQRHIPPEVAERLAGRVTRSELSARELDVLRLLVSGRRNREIAHSLAITEGTVKLHVSSILGKLGAVDRTEAATIALQRGFVQLDQ